MVAVAAIIAARAAAAGRTSVRARWSLRRGWWSAPTITGAAIGMAIATGITAIAGTMAGAIGKNAAAHCRGTSWTEAAPLLPAMAVGGGAREPCPARAWAACGGPATAT